MNIFIDIEYSFIRQPIKLALSTRFNDKVYFVGAEDYADLVIGVSDTVYTKPCIVLTENTDVMLVGDNVLAICPTPTNHDEMCTLIHKVSECISVLQC